MDLNAATITGANFPIVFHSNYGSILLCFRDMKMGRTTDDGQRTDDVNHSIFGPWRASKVKSGAANMVSRLKVLPPGELVA